MTEDTGASLGSLVCLSGRRSKACMYRHVGSVNQAGGSRLQLHGIVTVEEEHLRSLMEVPFIQVTPARVELA